VNSAPPEKALGRAGRAGVLLLDLAGLPIAVISGFGLLWYLPNAAVGTLLAIRRPRTSIGWLLLALAWVTVGSAFPLDATPDQFTSGAIGLPAQILAVLLSACGIFAFVLYASVMFVFPSGRLPAGRWGTFARIGLPVAILAAVVALFGPTVNVNLSAYPSGVTVPNPFAVGPELPVWDLLASGTSFVIQLVVMFGAGISLVWRFRRASGIERLQLRWIGAAAAAVVLAVLLGLVVGSLAPALAEAGVVWIPAIFAFAGIPVTIGIAVLRYRLYEIDRIISRTIGWAITTGLVVAVFAGLIVGLQALLAPIVRESTLAVAASTLVAAALVQPVRRRVQAVVDRRFNRSRYDAERTAAAFATRLRDEVELEAVADDLRVTVARSVHPTGSGLWLRRTGP
jgi:hypothetical protein